MIHQASTRQEPAEPAVAPTTAKRYEGGGILISRAANGEDWIDTLRASCLGMVTQDGGQFQLRINKALSPGYVMATFREHHGAGFDPEPPNIIEGTLTVQRKRRMQLPNEVTTHNLEHGGIVIAYNNLTPAETDQLKTIVRQLLSSGFPKIILEPYSELRDAKVALTAWTWLYKLPTIDQTQIFRFFRAHYDPVEAPERGAA